MLYNTINDRNNGGQAVVEQGLKKIPSRPMGVLQDGIKLLTALEANV